MFPAFFFAYGKAQRFHALVQQVDLVRAVVVFNMAGWLFHVLNFPIILTLSLKYASNRDFPIL